MISTTNQLKSTMQQLSEQSQSIKLEIAGIVLFLAFYAILSAFLESRHYPIHRGAIAVLIGVVVGLIIRLSSLSTYNQITKVNQTIIFLVLLPAILFTKGYTFRKGSFFRNIKFIILFGVVGTFLTYFILSSLIYAANTLNLVRDAKDITNIRTLSLWEILLLSACMCSIDTGASQEVVDQNKYPKLNAIIMGEDTLKDCVTIVLFRALLKLQNMSTTKFVFYWYTPFQVILNFLMLIVGSFVLGTISACLTTFLFKKFRFLLNDKGVSETTVLFLLGFTTYVLAQCLNLSGIISILCYGVILNRYNYFNLSPGGQVTSKNTFLFVSSICEGIMFLIMGIMVWQIQWEQQSADNPITHSYVFCAIVICILIVGRLFNVYFLWFIAKTISPSYNLNRHELFIIFVSGLARGATPFALFTSVQFLDSTSKYAKNQGLVLKTTIIIVVMLCTVILNSLVELMYKKPLKKLRNQAKQYLKQNCEINQSDNKLKLIAKSHFMRVQEQKIKPTLIYNYEARKMEIKQENDEIIRESIKKSLQELKKQEQQQDPFKKQAQESLISI